MKIPHHALVALANGERLIIMRNVGQPFEPKLEKVSEQDLLLTNFSAGVRHHEAANTAGSSSNIDELAHGAAIADFFKKATHDGETDPLVIAADPKTLGEIRLQCHQVVKDRIVGEVAKDLTNQPLEAIERALALA
ncbi:host attachment protein [Parafrankia sp. BMG5.11]|uniref:baeRF12 domain-containing protein n=1 Tax=Parafrankia sp. BMG5.11 TaxID=222540 RepID=UPI0010397BD0|nr:host attachment protein [Parafrankia sp. BMG5.11]TCJ41350.1 attachment protein [Parafrankia sp. BMG5.11]